MTKSGRVVLAASESEGDIGPGSTQVRALTVDELLTVAKPYLPDDFPVQKGPEIVTLIRERLEQLNQIEALTDFFFRPVKLEKEKLLSKATVELVAVQLATTFDSLSGIPAWD